MKLLRILLTRVAMRRTTILASALALTLPLLATRSADAARPYVVLQDDGTIEGHKLATLADELAIQKKLLTLYKATGEELPEILSVWSTFPLGSSPVGTFFDPLGADVKGIGLQVYYPPDGTMKSSQPPLRSILFHNDVTQLPKRASIQNAPLDGFARYLFLLELSHNWGPALQIPAPNAAELIGFDFHWSYWMDAGGSPAGGNQWKDNGDGTFTITAADPKTMKFSMLDLYVLGLATKDEVQPFGVLENVTPPMGISDPLWGGAYAGHSFPWFDAKNTFTATATRRTITIDDVIMANGARDPAAGVSQTTWKLGIILLTSKKDTQADLDAAQKIFDPLADSFAPAFHEATSMRGTMEVVTHEVTMGSGGAGGAGGAGGVGGMGVGGSMTISSTSGAGGTTSATTGGAAPSSSSGCSCETQGHRDSNAWSTVLVGIAALAASRRRARS